MIRKWSGQRQRHCRGAQPGARPAVGLLPLPSLSGRLHCFTRLGPRPHPAVFVKEVAQAQHLQPGQVGPRQHKGRRAHGVQPEQQRAQRGQPHDAAQQGGGGGSRGSRVLVHQTGPEGAWNGASQARQQRAAEETLFQTLQESLPPTHRLKHATALPGLQPRPLPCTHTWPAPTQGRTRASLASEGWSAPPAPPRALRCPLPPGLGCC